jgi:tyrosyl-tRNA synthetase
MMTNMERAMAWERMSGQTLSESECARITAGEEFIPPHMRPELKSEFLSTLKDRGYIHQCTDLTGLDRLCMEGPITAYVGFDATADSLHVGNLVSLMMLRILHKSGGTPIALIGTGTTKIGDPSDKNTQRPMLTEAEILSNSDGFFYAFDRILGRLECAGQAIEYRTKIVENGKWLDGLNYLDFMREVGPHFTINRMIGMEFVRNRLENQLPLTLLEFNYMILQSYDFVELSKRHGCRLQMGGSDQWGNIVNGIDLARRLTGVDLFGLTTNLITTSSGEKMGKTGEGKTIWLNAKKTSPYDYFQFWRNVEDDDVFRFLLLFTDITPDELDALEADYEKSLGYTINHCKEVLAISATTIMHGHDAAQNALEASRGAFGGDGGNLDALPSIPFTDGMTVTDAAMALGFAASKNEVRRLAEQNGLRLNDVTIRSGLMVLTSANFVGSFLKISVGKKKHGLVKIQTVD